jgi:hypothetical protein
MLVYEKNNKLNISFDNEIKENPDLQIGKSGDKTEILVDGSSNSGLPEYDDTMAGYVLKLVSVPEEKVVSEIKNVSGQSDTVLFAGFPTDESTSNAIHNWIESLSSERIYPDNGSLTNIHSIKYVEAIGDTPHITVLTNWLSEINYDEYEFYSDGRIQTRSRRGNTAMSFTIENLTFTIYGAYPKLVPQWVSTESASVPPISDGDGHETK